MNKIRQNWLQPTCGLFLILIILIPVASWEVANNFENSTKIIGMMIAGMFLGYVLSRSNMGFAGPIKKVVQNGDGRQAKALIFLFMFCSILAGGAMIAFGSEVFSYPLTSQVGVGTIIGAILFGIGMTLATGCASGTLSDVGDGMVPAFLTLLFFIFGSAVGVAFYGSALDVNFFESNANTSIGAAIGSIGWGIVINLLILGFILGIVIFIHKYRSYRKTITLIDFDQEDYTVFGDLEINPEFKWNSIFTYQTWAKLFTKRWSWAMGVVGLTFWFAFIILAFQETPGITGAYAHWGIEMTQGFGNENILAWHQDWKMMNDAQSWQNIGIIIGAANAKLLANKFKLLAWKKQKLYNWVLYALGGFLMGVGARMARGCNFGALFTGVTFQTAFGWVFFIFLLPASVGTSWIIKKIRHNTPNNVYRQK